MNDIEQTKLLVSGVDSVERYHRSNVIRVTLQDI